MLQKEDLLMIANRSMPFGKYKGRTLIDLPEEYLLWFVGRGFPAGKLGELMKLTLEIRINGLEAVLEPLRKTAMADQLNNTNRVKNKTVKFE